MWTNVLWILKTILGWTAESGLGRKPCSPEYLFLKKSFDLFISEAFVGEPVPAPSACFSCGINHFLLTLCSAPNMLHWSNPEISSHFSTPTSHPIHIRKPKGESGGGVWMENVICQNRQNGKHYDFKKNNLLHLPVVFWTFVNRPLKKPPFPKCDWKHHYSSFCILFYFFSASAF